MPTTTARSKVRYKPILKLPPLPRDQFLALRLNISVNGVLVPIIVDEEKAIIDGSYRKAIADELGYDCPEIVQHGLSDEEKRTLARALNLARRQLSTGEKRQLIADQLDETPERSNRWIGRQLGISHPTVASVRTELEATGKLFQLDKTMGADGRYRPKRLFQNPPELRHPDDYYPTPPHATQALLVRERFAGLILEPACGDGAVVRVLRKHGHDVEATDILDGKDFFARTETVTNIVTNPPHQHSLAFILHAKKIANRKIAMLLPVEFLHGVTRYELFQDRSFPLKGVYVFSSRLRFGSETPATIGHAWYVWDRRHKGDAILGWMSQRFAFVQHFEKPKISDQKSPADTPTRGYFLPHVVFQNEKTSPPPMQPHVWIFSLKAGLKNPPPQEIAGPRV